MKIDKNKIKELTNYLDELGLSELEYGDKDLKIKFLNGNMHHLIIRQKK